MYLLFLKFCKVLFLFKKKNVFNAIFLIEVKLKTEETQGHRLQQLKQQH